MQQPGGTTGERRSSSPRSRLIGAGVVVVGVLAAALVIGPRLRPDPIEPTPAPLPTTAAAMTPGTSGGPTASPGISQAPTITPTAVPTITVAASPTRVPPTPTTTPPTASPTPSGTADPARYLGRDPLPPGVDLTNGPFLKDLKARGHPGVNVGDGGLGDEIKAAYLEALKIEEEALNNNDDSRIRDHFTGEALERLQRLVARGKASTDAYADVIKLEARVMEFVPTTATPGKYEVVDARTQTINMVRKFPDGKPSLIVRQGEPERVCYSVQMLKVEGRWKVEFEEAHHDGPNGYKCPPGWS
jgi:hypothetical protein